MEVEVVKYININRKILYETSVVVFFFIKTPTKKINNNNNNNNVIYYARLLFFFIPLSTTYGDTFKNTNLYRFPGSLGIKRIESNEKIKKKKLA